MQLTLPQVPEPLKIWEKIEIIIADGDRRGLYLARIEDFVDGQIVISNPEFREGNTVLKDQCEVVVLVIREDAVYQFYSLMNRKEGDDRTLFVLTPPGDIKRVQRRQFVRVEMVLDITIAHLGTGTIQAPTRWLDTVCVNVSGGGMLIRSPEDIEPPAILLVKTDLLDRLQISQPVAALCRRSFFQKQHHYSGIEFLRSDDLAHHFYEDEMKVMPESVRRFDHRAQNKLVTHIFQQQIELRKKGLI